MYNLEFINFVGKLDILEPTHSISKESPVFIHYQESGDLSKHEILRRFKNILDKNNISYLKPLKHITNEWVIDLQELRHSYSTLKSFEYLKGRITVEADYNVRAELDEDSEEVIRAVTNIYFKIYPEDVLNNSHTFYQSENSDLKESLNRFNADYPNKIKCGFLMMKFEDSQIQLELVDIVKTIFKNINVSVLRADEKFYADDLFTNIKTYMHGCSFGIALFERINSNYFNPNVSLEVGYMMAMNKPILFLKDKTLNSLQTDLIGKLYHEFDFQKSKETLETVINKWAKDKQLI